MKWVRFEHEGLHRFGILQNDLITVTSLDWDDVLAGRPAVSIGTVPLSEIQLLSPLPRPGKIIAIGLNYMDHCREQNLTPPESPVMFCKFPTSVIGPDEVIEWSSNLTKEVDYEVELAVVIGRTARRVSQDSALDYVLGYTAANDVSARDLQFSDGQWVRGKSLDTFCPLGPALVTTDEIPCPQDLTIRCEVNGETLQDGHTKEMIFPVDYLVSFISQAFTLEPGDVILTGTPDGVGVFRDPQVFLGKDDQVAVEIENIGRMNNICRELD